jgi:hypothetical protein
VSGDTYSGFAGAVTPSQSTYHPAAFIAMDVAIQISLNIGGKLGDSEQLTDPCAQTPATRRR